MLISLILKRSNARINRIMFEWNHLEDLDDSFAKVLYIFLFVL